MSWVSFATILIGFVALACTSAWLAVPIALGLYLLWRTC
jgi:hypothetical protein